MHKFSFGLRAAAFAAVFALAAGSALQAQEEGGRGGRGARGGGQRGGGGGGGQRGQRGGGQRGGGQRGGGQRGGQRGFGGFGGGTTMTKVDLLRMEEVQKELKIGDDVLGTVNDAVNAYREKTREISDSMRDERPEFSREMARDREKVAEYTKKMEVYRAKVAKKTAPITKETEEILAVLLTEAQWKRLGEIETQGMMQRGVLAALLNKDFAAKLKITEEQSKKFADLKKTSDEEAQEAQTKMREQMREAFSGGGGGDFRAMMEEAQKAGQERQKKVDEKATGMLTDAQKKAMADMKGKEFKFPERGRGGFGGGRGGFGGRGQGGGGRGQGGGRGGRGGGGGGGNRPGNDRPGADGGGLI